MPPLRTILVPHDFSSHAQAAWARAEQLAWVSRATLHLLHVVHTPFLHALTPLGVVPFSMGPVVIEAASRTAHESLQWLADRSNCKVEVHVLEGPASYWICAHAERIGADLIVMGSSGRRGLARALLGSVTERTQRCAPCPVLVVPACSKGVEWDE
ncbi:MAG: universal stress protein [Myxococcota bacterium]